MAKEESASVSNDSKAYLDDVKKGKSRKFAMICKGTEVVSLVVYKKGGVEKRKKEAKEAGKASSILEPSLSSGIFVDVQRLLIGAT